MRLSNYLASVVH